ncbi:MAG: PD40 domain-containing protein [Flavobacteriales bacterium]|nr:PD40 domain-containing protein [Flavobacteriales bacterium]
MEQAGEVGAEHQHAHARGKRAIHPDGRTLYFSSNGSRASEVWTST